MKYQVPMTQFQLTKEMLEKPREVKKSVTNKELAEFLRLMKEKESEYSVVEQLHRTPIRMLSLVLISEPDRKAL